MEKEVGPMESMGKTGISGADGDNGERGECAHVVEGIVWLSCLPTITLLSS